MSFNYLPKVFFLHETQRSNSSLVIPKGFIKPTTAVQQQLHSIEINSHHFSKRKESYMDSVTLPLCLWPSCHWTTGSAVQVFPRVRWKPMCFRTIITISPVEFQSTTCHVLCWGFGWCLLPWGSARPRLWRQMWTWPCSTLSLKKRGGLKKDMTDVSSCSLHANIALQEEQNTRESSALNKRVKDNQHVSGSKRF